MIPLRAAIGAYPHTRALRDGTIGSPLLRLDFVEVSPINRAFAPMVRTQAYDVSEMAIATFLQARAYGKPLVLLPVVLAARFQEAALLCRRDSPISGPADLAGRRIGVRAYSQTTGMWLRGILADAFGLPADHMRWITFEGAHVAEVTDPRWAERAPGGADMMAMLRDGALDAVIVGNDVPDDPELRTVFPDPAAAGARFAQRYQLMPANHVLTVTRRVAEERPELVDELLRMTAGSYRCSATAPPIGVDALKPAVALAAGFAYSQGLLPRPLSANEIWGTA